MTQPSNTLGEIRQRSGELYTDALAGIARDEPWAALLQADLDWLLHAAAAAAAAENPSTEPKDVAPVQLSGSARLVLDELVTAAGQDHLVRLSEDELMALTARSRRSVQYAVASLAKAGCIRLHYVRVAGDYGPRLGRVIEVCTGA